MKKRNGMSVRIEPIKPDIGAIVQADRSDLFDDDFATVCLDALEARGVLVFPRLGLDDRSNWPSLTVSASGRSFWRTFRATRQRRRDHLKPPICAIGDTTKICNDVQRRRLRCH
jgi:hypothetical protein